MSNGSGCFLHFPLDLLGAEVTDASGMGVVYLSIGMEFPFLYLLAHLLVRFPERDAMQYPTVHLFHGKQVLVARV